MKRYARFADICLTVFVFCVSAAAQTLSPANVSFGPQLVGSSMATQSLTLTNTQSRVLTISAIAIAGDFSITSNCPLGPSTLAAGASCKVSVTFVPTVAGGRSGTLTISDDGANSPQTATLGGTGILPANLSVTALWLGTQALNTASTGKTVTLQNNQAIPLSITSIAASGDYAQTNNCPLAPASLGPKTSCVITVTFTPITTGSRTGTLSVTDDASNSPQSVSLSGTGVVPVGMSTTTMSFGNRVVNRTAPAQSVSVRNNTTPLTITSITTSGDFAFSTTCPTPPGTLASGAACTISVSFTPTALGPRLGTLSVVDNAATSPQTVALQGMGSLTGLSGITISPLSPTLAAGSQQQFRATGTFTDTSSQDITAFVTWTSSNRAVATATAGGLVSALAAGTTTIAGSYGGISGTTVLTVGGSRTLQSIAVTPSAISIPKAQTQQFKAVGTYSDGTTADLTATAAWTSSVPLIASISAGGLATGLSAGTTTIRATSGSVSGSATLTVTAPNLVSLSLSPAASSIAVGGTVELTATGSYSDGTTADLTTTAAWASLAPLVASISAGGLATGLSAGTTTIRATSGSVSGSATLSVTAPNLVSLSLSPAAPSIAVGSTVKLTATGSYSDGSTQDLSASVGWSSSAPSVACISANGLVNGLAAGTTTIIASSGSVTASTNVTVNSSGLVSLQLSPATVSMAVGSVQQLTATGTYSDGTTQDVSSSVTWGSSSTIAAVSATGLVSGVAAGQASVTASMGNATASAAITLTPMTWQPYQNPAWDGPLSAFVTEPDGDTLLAANGTGIYKSSDDQTWTFMGVPPEPGIESLLWSGTSLYAGTHDGVFVSSNEGATWTRFGSGLRTGACVFSLVTANGVFYAATESGLYRMAPGSTTWSVVVKYNEFHSLFVASSGLLLAGTTSGGNGGGPGGDIYTSIDGVTWTKVGIANAWSFRSFGQDASGTLYAGAYFKTFAPGGIYTSTDGGTTWTGPSLGTYSVQAITTVGSAVYLGTREGVLFAGPQAWQAIPNPSGKAILSLSYPFLGSDGVYRLDDPDCHPLLGSTPEVNQVLQDSAGITYWRTNYFGIWSSADGYIGPTGVEAAGAIDNLMFLNAAGEVLAFDEATIYHRVARQWIKATFPSSPIQGRFYCYVVLPDGSILIGDVNDRLWRSTDGGSSFTYWSTTSGSSGVTFALVYANNLLYGASEAKNVIVSSDYGKTWTALPQFVSGSPNVNTDAVAMTAAGTLLGGRMGGTELGCLFRFVNGAWQRSDNGIPLYESVFSLYSTPGAVYALTDKATYQSVDDGQTWVMLSGPKFFSAYTAEFRPITLMMTSDGHIILGVHWEGRGAYISAP